ncbi:MAG: class I SAM-dependent methyltransferase [Pseudomonadota bacterium]
MNTSPFEILTDDRARAVLEDLHSQADKQLPGLLMHYLPKIPSMILGRKIHFKDADMYGFYSDKFIALEREQAAFVYATARSLRAKTVVEFGTSLGISTLWLAAAVKANGGGKVITTEIVPEKAAAAKRNFIKAGFEDYIDVRVGDARETLRDIPGEVDLMLNDGFPNLALDILKLLQPSMKIGGVVITDNIGTFKGNYADYLGYVKDPSHGFVSVTLPFKAGTEYSVKT